MLVAHLLESDDDLPLLARIIQGRMEKGERVVVNAALIGSSHAFGEIITIRLGTPLKMLGKNGQPMEIPRLFIRWKPLTRDGRALEWVRADSFDANYKLEKDEDGDWVLERSTA